MHRVLFVLPKANAYRFDSIEKADVEYAESFTQQLMKWVEFFENIPNIEICCIYEDRLARALLSNRESIHWLSVLGFSDEYFFKSYYKDLPATYLVPGKADKEVITAASKRFPIKKDTKFVDEIAFFGYRESVMQSRIRYVVDSLLETERLIVYFDKHNNYCKEPSTEMGDGKLVITCNLSRMFESYVFGGIPLNKEQLDLVLKGVSNADHI